MNDSPSPGTSQKPIWADQRSGLSPADAVEAARAAQPAWAATPLRERLRIIRRLRHLIAREAEALAATVGRRDARETLAAEVLPLAEACRHVEREAPRLLAPRRLGARGRPLWLFAVDAEIRREPHGLVLVIGPSNYPLFLPGVQAIQALAAGNAVLVKPGADSAAPMRRLAALAVEAGLDARLLGVLGEAPDEARAAIEAGIDGMGVDKVILTGSAATGERVMATLAPRLVPATMELSGNDAVFVLDGADLDLVAGALAYGLRFNDSATCIAPRRVFVPAAAHDDLADRLARRVEGAPPVTLPEGVARLVERLLAEARGAGSRLLGGGAVEPGDVLRPTIATCAAPSLGLLREDVFAPVLSLVPVAGTEEALALAAACPYALGAAIFGPPEAARRLAERVDAGSVVINDVIVPTADPRLPFGGRRRSGFGVTRGAEGLLEMTQVKAISLHRGRFRPYYAPLGPKDGARFAALIRLLHGATWRERREALLALVGTLRK